MLALEAGDLRRKLSLHGHHLGVLITKFDELRTSVGCRPSNLQHRGLANSNRGRGRRHGTTRDSFRVFGSSRAIDPFLDD